MAILTSVSVAAVAIVGVYFGISNRYFAGDACERLDSALSELVIGQPLATRAVTENVCAHLNTKLYTKPLVLSIHGPPGTGKTLTHWITAQAVYGLIGAKDRKVLTALKTLHGFKRTSEKYLPVIKDVGTIYEEMFGNPLNCPGSGCPAYKVLYGTDYIKLDRNEQIIKVRDTISSHADRYPESIIVIEEYEKMHCDTRNMLRQMLHNPSILNVPLNKAIIFLEANRGMFHIQEVLKKAGKRESVSFFDAHHMLKVDMYDYWTKQSCDKPIDVAKFINRIELFIAFFPLEKQHLRDLIVQKLKAAKMFVEGGRVQWSSQVVDYFVSQVKFDGVYAIDGAVDAELALKKLHEVLRAAEKAPEAKTCGSVSRVVYGLEIRNNEVVVRNWCSAAT